MRNAFARTLTALASADDRVMLLSGDIGCSAVFEQQIYRVPHSDDRGIGVFTKATGAPPYASPAPEKIDAGGVVRAGSGR